MREESEFLFNEEETLDIVQRYETMLKHSRDVFFDVFEFESIIDHYLGNQHTQQALEAIARAQRIHPYSTEIQIRKSEFLVINGKPNEALPILKFLLKVESESSEVHFLLGNAYLLLGDSNQAEKFFRAAVGFETEDKAFMLYRIAGLYQEVDEFNISITYLQSAFLNEPENLGVIFDLGYCYERVGNLDQSVVFYNKYLDFNPFSVSVWYNLGIVYTRKGDFTKAIEAYDFALAIDPQNSSSLHNMASTLAALDRYPEALAFLNELLTYEPGNPKTLCSMGECYERMRDYSQAETSYRACLELEPATAEAYYGLGMVYMEQKQFQSSKESIRKAIAIDSENYDFWLGLARVNFELDLYNETLEAYREAIVRNPEEPEAFLGLSEALLYHEQYNQIEQLYDDISVSFAHIPMLKVILAAAQYLSNRPNDALNTLRLAKRIDPNVVNAFLSIVSITGDREFDKKLARI